MKKAIYAALIAAVFSVPAYAQQASGAAGGMGHGHGGSAGSAGGSSGHGGSAGSGASGGNSSGLSIAWFERGPQNIEESVEATAQADRILDAGINRR